MQKGTFTKIVVHILIIPTILCFTIFTYAQDRLSSSERLMSNLSFPPMNAVAADNSEGPGYLRWGPNGLDRGIPYSSVTGSPFWSDEWKIATLFGRTPKEIWKCKTKLNLATGEIYFLDKQGEEKVLDNGIVKSILFYNNDDSATISAHFISSEQAVLVNEQKVNPYLQVLNDGDYQLLKLTTRIVSTGDSMLGTLKRYYFSSQTKYFVSGNSKTEPVKKLKKENILVYLPNSSQYNAWIDQHKIDFRKEKDIIAFFDYYNSQNLSGVK